MQHVFQVYTREKLAWIAIVCWNLWNRRNKWLWDKVNVSAFGVQSTAVSMKTEWDKAQHEKKVVKPAVSATGRRWIRLPQGWVKINVDAVTFTANGSIGLGSVIRNEDGTFVGARSKKMEVLLHPREAEAVSLNEALSWTKELGFKQCIFETDAKLVVDAINKAQGCAFFIL
ncbi:uncharacterized protein LOC141713950 [Apium graveolens]|uniref:uncharacterized protein LOC141713950 n=1 Tax=Apium graveolens TaxID=4045 RepID=UPI003D7B2797